jgi:hypothetical protein
VLVAQLEIGGLLAHLNRHSGIPSAAAAARPGLPGLRVTDQHKSATKAGQPAPGPASMTACTDTNG